MLTNGSAAEAAEAAPATATLYVECCTKIIESSPKLVGNPRQTFRVKLTGDIILASR